ncbi:hypothetical protein PUN28_003123 [Cardiocondyla obscurior]|uniref:Uncharacterized protein n=1 Tax=Cardiocondyla obscurior TaxID=286306 RepID=A0AAW2GN30_9HYME
MYNENISHKTLFPRIRTVLSRRLNFPGQYLIAIPFLFQIECPENSQSIPVVEISGRRNRSRFVRLDTSTKSLSRKFCESECHRTRKISVCN